MAGVWTDEGENRVADILFDDQAVDATLYMGIFTNSSGLGETSTMSDITEPSGGSGGGYARIALTRGDWTVTGAAAAYAQQTFTANAEDWGACYGWFINTAETGTAGKLLCHETFTSPFDIDDGDSIKVTPTITIA